MSAIFGEILTFGQANGDDVQLKVFGDEHYARYESLDGFTAVYDASSGSSATRGSPPGALRSTGVPITDAPPAGVARHLQEDPAGRRSASPRRASCGEPLSPAAGPDERRPHVRPQPGPARRSRALDRAT